MNYIKFEFKKRLYFYFVNKRAIEQNAQFTATKGSKPNPSYSKVINEMNG